MGKHVFLSFVAEDLDDVNLFRGQAKRTNSLLSFDDYSVKDPFSSFNAAYIREKIAAKIRAASITICLIGETTASSKWVDWEIRKSIQLGNRVLGVRVDSDSRRNPTPPSLVEVSASVVDWNIQAIVDFIG